MARIYILQNGAMWNCERAEYAGEMEPGDYVIYLISAEGRSDEQYLAQTLLALGYPLGALSSYFFEEPEEEDLSRLISPGAGLALHEDGRLKVSGADIIAPGGGIALDESRRLRAAPSDMIAAGGGLAAGGDGKLKAACADIVAPGGGLAVSEDKIRIEVSGMSQAERERLALALGVLPRLAADLNIYVATTGSDVLDAGRGLSADKSFKSVQAAVNWLRSSHDLGFYNAIFHIGPGAHAGAVIDRFVASGGGGLVFQGAETGASPLSSIIRADNASCFMIYGDNKITFKNIRFESGHTAAVYRFCSQLSIFGGEVALDRFEAEINLGNDMAANANARFARVANASLVIKNSGAAPSKISVLNYTAVKADCVFDIQPDGLLHFDGASSQETSRLIFTGGARDCLILAAGRFSRNMAAANPVIPQGEGFSARRYLAQYGAVCQTYGAGPEFFPGDAAGSCDATSVYY